MSMSDLKTRPIFHYTQEALRAHVLVCFMVLMMGKYLEAKRASSYDRSRTNCGKFRRPISVMSER